MAREMCEVGYGIHHSVVLTLHASEGGMKTMTSGEKVKFVQ